MTSSAPPGVLRPPLAHRHELSLVSGDVDPFRPVRTSYSCGKCLRDNYLDFPKEAAASA